MPPAARVTDMHTCPMVTGVVPHVGGPILPPGAPTVLTVLIGNLMAARLGDPTVHGGVIILGEMTVMIGEVGMGSPVVVTPMPPMVALANAMNSAPAQALAQAAQNGTPFIEPCPG
jgi:uncharacterized Zn-binding protein involved in type VI secretion